MDNIDQVDIISKAIKKFGDLDKVSVWSGIPIWILKNMLKGNQVRKTQYDKLLWMRDRLK